MNEILLKQFLEDIRADVLDKIRPKEWMDINEASEYSGLPIDTIYIKQ